MTLSFIKLDDETVYSTPEGEMREEELESIRDDELWSDLDFQNKRLDYEMYGEEKLR